MSVMDKESQIKRLEDALKNWATDEWKDEPRRADLAIADIKRRLDILKGR